MNAMEPMVTISESRTVGGRTTTVSVSGPARERGELAARIARLMEALAPGGEAGQGRDPARGRWLAEVERRRVSEQGDRTFLGEPCANPDPEERVA